MRVKKWGKQRLNEVEYIPGVRRGISKQTADKWAITDFVLAFKV